jgi:SAM-dependent methyltransferase
VQDWGLFLSAKANDQQSIVASTFDEVSTGYEQQVNGAMAFSGLEVDLFARAKADRLKELAQRALGDPSSLRVLDIGCGVGAFHRHLQSTFRELHGLDVSASSIEVARKANPGCHYQVYDGQAAPYEAGAFDLVFAACVIHHVPPENWPSFVAEIKRLLRPGGMIVVFEHNPFNPLTRLVVSRCEFDEDAVLLSRGQLRSLAVKAGFSEIASRSIFTLPPISPLLVRLDSLFGQLPFGSQHELLARA